MKNPIVFFICTILLLAISTSQQTQNKLEHEKNKENKVQGNVQQQKQPSNLQKQVQNQQSTQKESFSHYKRIFTSSHYYNNFSTELSKISFSQVVNVTHMGNGNELCLNQTPCEFYYYIIKPKFDPQRMTSFQMNGDQEIKNVFIVAGMHGNQYLGPMSLLYSLKFLEAPSTRIIIFPLANPSGFDKNKRLTYPGNLDPNRDFPIQQYTKCYQTTSSLIIDHIYRKYHIDLTIALHNGQTQIGWNWGTVREQINSKTLDEPIYRDIGEWLKFAGGMNQDIKMNQFKIGTMNEVVYPVKGAFQDWAYAASWYNASKTAQPSKSCPFTQYPFNMTNGLVFLFELGPFQVDQKLFGSQQGVYAHPLVKNKSNGYVSRTIRMLNGLTKILNPRLDFKFTNEKVILSLNGCKNGLIQNLRISDKEENKKIFFQSNSKETIIGNLNNETIEPTIYELQQGFYSPQYLITKKFSNLQTKNLTVQYNLTCDSHWQGKGQTTFGKKRQFNVRQTILLSTKATQYNPRNFFSSLSQNLQSTQLIYKDQAQEKSFVSNIMSENNQTLLIIIILIVILSTMICVIWVILKEIRKDIKTRRIQRLKKKLQRINNDSSIEQINSYNQSSQITLSEIKFNQKKNNQLGKQKKKPVDSYPQMCQSDKSMKTEQLNSQRNTIQ